MNKDTLYVKRKRPTDMLLLAAIYISATLAVALLLGIILYVFVKGIHTVNWAFLTTVTSARKQTTGIAQCHLDKDYTKNSVYRNMYPVLFL